MDGRQVEAVGKADEVTVVKLVQMLCPARHCVLMTAYEEDAADFLGACERWKKWLEQREYINGNVCFAARAIFVSRNV